MEERIMIGPEDEELLHRALDGTLSADETARLRVRLAADPALRARADSLKRLAALIDEHGQPELPMSLTDRVMAAVAAVPPPRPAWYRRLASLAGTIGHQLLPGFAHHSEQRNRQLEFFRKTGMAGGGVIVAKKALWGIAGLAVVVILVVVYFNGTRSVDQGAQGTIGAADRYRGAQPASVSAQAGDVQAFLQSDTFDKLVKDKNVRTLLADNHLRAVLADTNVEAAVGSKAMQDAIMDPAIANALGTHAMHEALNSESTRAILSKPNIQAMLGDSALIGAAIQGNPKALAGNPDLALAVKNNLFVDLVQNQVCVTAFNKSLGAFTAMMNDANFRVAMQKNLNFVDLISSLGFQGAVINANFAAQLGPSSALSKVLLNPAALDQALAPHMNQQ